jgi:hypothetical protein
MVTLAPVLRQFLQRDGGRMTWTEDGEVSFSCDRPEPLSFHEFAGPLAYAELVRLVETILDYRTALEANDYQIIPELVDALGVELAALVRASLREPVDNGGALGDR